MPIWVIDLNISITTGERQTASAGQGAASFEILKQVTSLRWARVVKTQGRRGEVAGEILAIFRSIRRWHDAVGAAARE